MFGPLYSLSETIENPALYQSNLLRQILVKSQSTEWGRRHNFKLLLKTPDLIKAYKKNLPIFTYEEYREDILRILCGELDILWPGQYQFFANSSGSVSKGKVFPISTDMMEAMKRGNIDAVLCCLDALDDFSPLRGKLLATAGTTIKGKDYEGDQYPDNAWVGDISGLFSLYISKGRPSPFDAVTPKIRSIAQFEERETAMIDHAMDQKVRCVAIMPSNAVMFFRRLINRYNQKYNTSVKNVHGIWPDLRVVFCGGASLSCYKKGMQEIIGSDNVALIEAYGASEGYIAFQNSPVDEGLLIHPNAGVYFEFIKMEDKDKTNAEKYSLDEVETGCSYIPILTNCSGLFSYMLDDTIEFTGVCPYTIKMTGRISEYLSRFREFMTRKEMDGAVSHAENMQECMVSEFHVAPYGADEKNENHHEWFVEFSREPQDLRSFIGNIDDYLKSVNSHYSDRRSSGAVAMPQLVVLKPGAFQQWLKATKGDKFGPQSKIIRSREDRVMAEELLKLNQ